MKKIGVAFHEFAQISHSIHLLTICKCSIIQNMNGFESWATKQAYEMCLMRETCKEKSIIRSNVISLSQIVR